MASIIDPATTIGLVSLSVADLERSLAYYQERIGLHLLDRTSESATLSVADVPLLRLHESPHARQQRQATGLYHFALRVPTRHALAQMLDHLARTQTPIGGAADHIVSEALYLSDPDGHGIEIYRDRPREAWYDERGNFAMGTLPLDIDGLLRELPAEASWNGLAVGSDMGHIHLHVAHLAVAEQFYTTVLGFEQMAHMPSASFVSAGGYHHHIGMNTWAGVGVPAPAADAARLLSYEIVLPTQASLYTTLDRIRDASIPLEQHADGWLVRDPSANTIVLRTTE